MIYILLLRGINVGGKNKVVMKDLKDDFRELGFENVLTYINSGNIIFETENSLDDTKKIVSNYLQRKYDFDIKYSLISKEDFLQEFKSLPKWWFDYMARKDVIFFTDEVDPKTLVSSIEKLELHNERYHLGEKAIFWGKYDEAEFLKTAYHKYFIKQPYYKQITIRNWKTLEKLLGMIEKTN